jgi:hypothetical protein
VAIENRMDRADRQRVHVRKPGELLPDAPQLGLSCLRRAIRVSMWTGSWLAWRLRPARAAGEAVEAIALQQES